MQLNIIALIDSFGATSYGGAGKVFIEVNKVLAAQGHVVDAICRSGDDIPDDLFGDITFHTYRDIAAGQLSKIKHYQKSVKSLFSKQLETNKPDLILLHSSSAGMGLETILKKADIPIVYYFHSPWSKEYEIIAKEKGMTFCGGQCPLVTILSAIRKRHEGKYLRLADGIVNLSKSMQQIMLDTHKCVSKISKEIIPGGANGKIFFPTLDQKEKVYLKGKLKLPKDDFLIITSRRLVPRTGVDMLIEAFAKMLKEQQKSPVAKAIGDRSNMKLILTGSGISTEQLKQQVKDLEIEEQVIFTGYVSEARLAEYYRCCDLFVMPTKFLEGFGLSTVEAMASGLPVIGTNIGGTPEILSKIPDDLIISECTEEAITAKMLEFVSKTDSDLNDLRKKSIQCVADNFTWEKHVEHLLEFVSKIGKK